jgi:hypothetical protein
LPNNIAQSSCIEGVESIFVLKTTISSIYVMVVVGGGGVIMDPRGVIEAYYAWGLGIISNNIEKHMLCGKYSK